MKNLILTFIAFFAICSIAFGQTSNPDSTAITALAVQPNGTLWADTQLHLYRSTDNGNSRQIVAGFGGKPVYGRYRFMPMDRLVRRRYWTIRSKLNPREIWGRFFYIFFFSSSISASNTLILASNSFSPCQSIGVNI